MTLSDDERKAFAASAGPLMQWLSDNCHPHVTAIVDSGRAELLEGIALHMTDKSLEDSNGAQRERFEDYATAWIVKGAYTELFTDLEEAHKYATTIGAKVVSLYERKSV